jgi:cephalosporin hydroxylase
VDRYIINDLKRLWGRIAANERWYEHNWLGVPIWQMPEDLMRLQEICYEVQPDWIIETGTKFGGSAIFFASLLDMMGKKAAGVITIDITSTERAGQTLSSHPLRGYVKKTIIGDAASASVADETRAALGDAPGTVLVFLDDNHNADHVSREIELYAPLVTPGSYLIVADTIYQDLADSPAGIPSEKYPDVATSNPRVAVENFLATDNGFTRDERFIERGVGNFPDGFLKRKA